MNPGQAPNAGVGRLLSSGGANLGVEDRVRVLRSLGFAYVAADVTANLGPFPLNPMQVRRVIGVGPAKLQAMWRLGLLTCDPAATEARAEARLRGNRNRSKARSLDKRIQKIEATLRNLNRRRAKLRRERNELLDKLHAVS